jgi:hypothetical protein
MTEQESYDGWYLVEQMGHKRLAGYVREITLAGAGLLRVDVPSEPPMTQLIHPSTLYCLTPIDEALARRLAERYRPEPVSRYEMAALPPAPPVEAMLADDEVPAWYGDENDDDDDDDEDADG